MVSDDFSKVNKFFIKPNLKWKVSFVLALGTRIAIPNTLAITDVHLLFFGFPFLFALALTNGTVVAILILLIFNEDVDVVVSTTVLVVVDF